MKLPSKKITIIVSAAVLLLAGGALGLHYSGMVDIPLLPDKEKKLEKGEINYGPPTEEEKRETEQFKESLGNESSPSQPPPPGQKQSVTPVISSWGQPDNQDVEVSGYVPGVFEEGGTCTVNMEKDGQKVAASKLATLSAQNVSCGFISVNRAQLSPGKWRITLSYSSTSAEGTSTAVDLEVKYWAE